MTDLADIIAPRARADFLGADGIEAQLSQALNSGALANGWLITGGAGIGKATLAFRLARALLWRERPQGSASLAVPQSERVFSLVASGGHPDLFVADRRYDEKKERYATEISVETVRDLTHFLSQTAAMGGWRVAIIDMADDLNRNSANALLKVLEEPPPRSAIFVLSAAPGRLLATIRSRCRRIELRPLPDEQVAQFLIREEAAKDEEAMSIARVADGRPGYALSLALGDGAKAIAAVDEFWSAAESGADVGAIAQQLCGKDAEGVFTHFQAMLTARIAGKAKRLAVCADARARDFVDLRERIETLFARGEAVNLDKFQLVLAAGRAFKAMR
ncbi:MAG: DNA polymerase III subunit delta' [Pseudomonadota bacterium]